MSVRKPAHRLLWLTMAEQIGSLRQWAKRRARAASSLETEANDGVRKLAA